MGCERVAESVRQETFCAVPPGSQSWCSRHVTSRTDAISAVASYLRVRIRRQLQLNYISLMFFSSLLACLRAIACDVEYASRG